MAARRDRWASATPGVVTGTGSSRSPRSTSTGAPGSRGPRSCVFPWWLGGPIGAADRRQAGDAAAIWRRNLRALRTIVESALTRWPIDATSALSRAGGPGRSRRHRRPPPRRTAPCATRRRWPRPTPATRASICRVLTDAERVLHHQRCDQRGGDERQASFDHRRQRAAAEHEEAEHLAGERARGQREHQRPASRRSTPSRRRIRRARRPARPPTRTGCGNADRQHRHQREADDRRRSRPRCGPAASAASGQIMNTKPAGNAASRPNVCGIDRRCPATRRAACPGSRTRRRTRR